MYPAYDGDYRVLFIQQMVRDLESYGVTVRKAVKTSARITGYVPFYYKSLILSRDNELDIIQAEYIPHSSIIPVIFRRKNCPLILKFHGDDARIFPFKNPLFKALTSVMIHRSDYIITSSEEIRLILILNFGPKRIKYPQFIQVLILNSFILSQRNPCERISRYLLIS